MLLAFFASRLRTTPLGAAVRPGAGWFLTLPTMVPSHELWSLWYTHTMVHSHELWSQWFPHPMGHSLALALSRFGSLSLSWPFRSQWLCLSCSHTDAHGRHANVGSWLLGSFALLRCELRGALKCSYSGNFTISGSVCARSRGRCQSRGPVGRSTRSVASNRVARAERVAKVT